MMSDQSPQSICVKEEPVNVVATDVPIHILKVETREQGKLPPDRFQWESDGYLLPQTISVKPEPVIETEHVPANIDPVVQFGVVDTPAGDINIPERVPIRLTMAKRAFAKRGALYKCGKCKYYGDKAQMRRHFVKYHLPKVMMPFACSKCNTFGRTLTQITKHFKQKHPTLKIEDCLQGSRTSYNLKAEDATILSKEQSINLYRERSTILIKDPQGSRKMQKKLMPVRKRTRSSTMKSAKQLKHLETPKTATKRKNQNHVLEKPTPKVSRFASSPVVPPSYPYTSVVESVVSRTRPVETSFDSTVPLSMIEELVEQTVYNTMEAMAPAIISAARSISLPREQDLGPISNQLMATNANLAQLASILEMTNKSSSELCTGLEDITKTISGLTSEISKASQATSEFTEVARKLNQHMAEQTTTMQGLIQGTLDAHANLANVMQHMVECSREGSGPNSFNGLSENHK